MSISATLGLTHMTEHKLLHMSQAMATALCSGLAHSKCNGMWVILNLFHDGLISPLYFPGTLLGIIIPVAVISLFLYTPHPVSN